MFGLGFTQKLKDKIAELGKQIADDSKRIDKMSSHHNSRVALRDGEISVLKTKLEDTEKVSNALRVTIKTQDAAIDTWMEKSKSDQTKIDMLESKNSLLKTDIKDRDQSIKNLESVISDRIKSDFKTIESEGVFCPAKPKKKRKLTASQKAYYNRGKKKK